VAAISILDGLLFLHLSMMVVISGGGDVVFGSADGFGECEGEEEENGCSATTREDEEDDDDSFLIPLFLLTLLSLFLLIFLHLLMMIFHYLQGTDTN
jgi:hypothetical protein